MPTSKVGRGKKNNTKDGLALTVGPDAASDLKLKPVLIYHYKNPRVLPGMPTFWLAWVTLSEEECLRPHVCII